MKKVHRASMQWSQGVALVVTILLLSCQVAASTRLHPLTPAALARMERSFDHSPRHLTSSHPKVATAVGDRETVFGPFKYVSSDGLVSTTFAAPPAQYIENAEIHVEQIDGDTGSIEVVVNGELAIPGSSLGTTVHEATVPIVLARIIHEGQKQEGPCCV